MLIGDAADLIGHDLNGLTPLTLPRFDHLHAYEDITRRGALKP